MHQTAKRGITFTCVPTTAVAAGGLPKGLELVAFHRFVTISSLLAHCCVTDHRLNGLVPTCVKCKPMYILIRFGHCCRLDSGDLDTPALVTIVHVAQERMLWSTCSRIFSLILELMGHLLALRQAFTVLVCLPALLCKPLRHACRGAQDHRDCLHAHSSLPIAMLAEASAQ